MAPVTSRPLWKSADTFSLSMGVRSLKARAKDPNRRSLRAHLTSWASLVRRLTPRTDRLPPGADKLVPLGFALRLDEFEVDRYENLYRLRAYAPEGGDPTSARWLPTGSWSPEEAREWVEREIRTQKHGRVGGIGAREFSRLGDFL